MKRMHRATIAALAFGVCGSCSPAPEAGGAGSSTSWLRSCDASAGCDGGLECTCGICVRGCSENAECGTLPNARCAATNVGIGKAICGLADSSGAAGGLCLPECESLHPCANGLACIDNACVPVSMTSSACGLGSSISLEASAQPVQTRHGMLFMNGFYEPVSYAEEPVDWVEPVTPVTLVATVLDASGEPVQECPLVWQTAEGSGWAYPEASTTNVSGKVSAVWVAGAATQQTLGVALEGPAGAVVHAAITGEARAHNDAPFATDATVAQASVGPTMVFLDYPLSADADAIQVELTPVTFPHETYYAAVAFDGFFTGLQNTSAMDASSDSIPDASRILIASVWNVTEGDALLLWNDPAVTCGSHTQDAGGVRCDIGAAWQLGAAVMVTTEYRILTSGEAAPADYSSLGYSTAVCGSSAGCTDYTVYLRQANEAAPGHRLLAYRYARAVRPAHFFSYIEAYSSSDKQPTSCLEQPSHHVLVSAAKRVGGEYSPVETPQLGATYSTWQNSVCANYGAVRQNGKVLLATGGPAPLSRPLLPSESRRSP